MTTHLLTLVEPDVEHNLLSFQARLHEAIRHYLAVFECLESLLPRTLPERQVIEQVFFGQEMQNILTCEGSDRIERHQRRSAWWRRLQRTGFMQADITAGAGAVAELLRTLPGPDHGC